jgi:hypothetical protein
MKNLRCIYGIRCSVVVKAHWEVRENMNRRGTCYWYPVRRVLPLRLRYLLLVLSKKRVATPLEVLVIGTQ